MLTPNKYLPASMLGIAFLSQNVATGLTFGCFGLLIEPLTRDLQGSRSVISLAIALILLTNGVLSPLVGRWVDRWSLRGTMLIGASSGAVGFYLASQATSPSVFLFSFGLLVGIGFAMVGVIPPNKIAALWFPRHFGRASGITNLPMATALLPPLFAYAIGHLGWRALLQGFALVYIILFGLILLLRMPSVEASTESVKNSVAAMKSAPYRTQIFWVLSLLIGMVTTSGIVASTHIVAYAQSQGIAVAEASLLVSIFGIFSVLGAAFYGWFCDRFSAPAALTLICLCGAILWLLLGTQHVFIGIAAIVAGLGLGGGGLLPTMAALLSRAFGSAQLGSALGQMSLAILPFTFVAAPLVGWCYDRFGNYRGAFVLEAALCATSLLLVLLLRKKMNPQNSDSNAAIDKVAC
ncbi:MAG TPA: MFS transporter [Spongiibacteraceae bacterium]|nr:MFS transporter [Spongiibacteraceae bacterium]